MTNRKANYQNNVNWLLLKFLTLLVLIYLVAIPLGYVSKKFELTDVVIFAIILIFNSELVERLIKLGINKDGITLDLSQIKAEQDNQKASIETNTANIEAVTNIVQRLTILE